MPNILMMQPAKDGNCRDRTLLCSAKLFGWRPRTRIAKAFESGANVSARGPVEATFLPWQQLQPTDSALTLQGRSLASSAFTVCSDCSVLRVEALQPILNYPHRVGVIWQAAMRRSYLHRLNVGARFYAAGPMDHTIGL